MRKIFYLLPLLLLLLQACGNTQKAEIIKMINEYDFFVETYRQKLEAIVPVDDADLFFLDIQEIRLAYFDSAGFRRKLVSVMISESEMSETNRDELLTRLVHVQHKAFDVYAAIDSLSTKAQLMNLESIRGKILLLSHANQSGENNTDSPGILNIENKIQRIVQEGNEYLMQIESLRSEMKANKSAILDWNW